MDARVLQSFTFFFLCLLLSSDSSIAEKLPLEAIFRQNQKLDQQESRVIFPPLASSGTQLDTIPIVNPTTPTTETPTIMSGSPPPPPATTTAPTTIPTTTPTTTTPSPTTSGGAWCVGSPSASETALQVALDYACGYGGADCSAIQPGGSCYNPSSVRDHASYAFNDYYQKNPIPTSCVFGGTAQLTYTDPSSGNCHYAAPRTSTSTLTPPTTTTTPTPPSPSTTSSVNPYSPSVPTIYGSEPTATPSSTDSMPHNRLLHFTMICFSLLAANYL